jgi:GGDEF domain-containing protein
MFPQNSNLFCKWKAIYEELLDPITTAVDTKYLPALFEEQLNYCKTNIYPFSTAILRILSLPTHNTNSSIFNTYTVVRNIVSKIKESINSNDMVFYDGVQTFSFLFPNTHKAEADIMLEKIEEELEKLHIEHNMQLSIKGGHAEFPSDAYSMEQLQECAYKALMTSSNIQGNKILGYFSERRKSKRAPIKIEVRYFSKDTSERLTCSRNISEEGIMLNGLSDLPLGEDINLRFNISGTINSKLTLTAKTLWNHICTTTGKMDIGLYFTDINSSTKDQIKNFISTIFPPIVHL